jgi:hypothetical protein
MLLKTMIWRWRPDAPTLERLCKRPLCGRFAV